jgi:hypothetical protein
MYGVSVVIVTETPYISAKRSWAANRASLVSHPAHVTVLLFAPGPLQHAGSFTLNSLSGCPALQAPSALPSDPLNAYGSLTRGLLLLVRPLCLAVWPRRCRKALLPGRCGPRRIAAGHRTAYHTRDRKNRNRRVNSTRALSAARTRDPRRGVMTACGTLRTIATVSSSGRGQVHRISSATGGDRGYRSGGMRPSSTAR